MLSQTRRLTDDLRTLVLDEPILAIDQEGGRVARLPKGFTVFPGQGALGQAGTAPLAYAFAEVTARELRAIGVTVRECDEDTGEQFRWRTLGGHFSGAVDGLAKGFPEAPKTLAVTEYKTLNDKYFAKYNIDVYGE